MSTNSRTEEIINPIEAGLSLDDINNISISELKGINSNYNDSFNSKLKTSK